MIQLTNAEQAYMGQPIMLNASMIEAIYDADDGGSCRINMNSGHHYIVQETFEEISELLYPHSHVPSVPPRGIESINMLSTGHANPPLSHQDAPQGGLS